MNARQRRKLIKARTDADVLKRLELKMDLILEHCDRADKRSAVIGAVSGGLAGGAVAFVMAYARAALLGDS